MPQIQLRFYAELNDYLPVSERYRTIPYSTKDHHTIGELVKNFGMTLDEIDIILVNGESVDCSYEVIDGDSISVYPVFESFDVSSLTKIRSKPLRESRFILDVHLGKLAYYLRMLGFDVLYRNDFRDDELVRISVVERRILLSKDRELLADPQIARGYHVQAKHPPEQLTEILRRFDLFHSVLPFRRCIRCNNLLEPVSKEIVLGQLPPAVAQSYNEFQRCPVCSRVYWKGSHYSRMEKFIVNILNSKAEHPLR